LKEAEMLTVLVVVATVVGGALWYRKSHPTEWAAWVTKVKSWFTADSPV
jgi:hypothetical protein